MIKNERIRAAEVALQGVDGEDLGVVPTSEALAMAKQLKVDLVCLSLASSPPPCRLIRAGAAREAAQQSRRREAAPKRKELRFTTQIEAHDLDTKLEQAQRMLRAGDSALLVVNVQGKDNAAARRLLEDIVGSLRQDGKPASGIQASGKRVAVQLDPI